MLFVFFSLLCSPDMYKQSFKKCLINFELKCWIWKSDLTDKIKRRFFPITGRVITAIWMHHMDANFTYGEKASLQIHKDAASHIEQFLEATT